MNWKEKALDILEDSLYPVAVELNELDWKSGLSCKTERLAQHLCAFSNLKGGGILVFGVNDDATFSSMTKEACDDIIKKLGNIAKNNLSSSISVTTRSDGLMSPCRAISMATRPIGPHPARIATFPPSFIPITWS